MFENKYDRETKVCNVCGRELPIEKMVKGKSICKECYNKYRREQRAQRWVDEFIADESMKLKRKYKNVRPIRILAVENTGIKLIESDEVFVKLVDYRDVWISNYGRALTLYGGKYALMHKKYVDGEVAYQLYKNVYDGKKWTFEKRLVKAWTLVVQEFVINYDIANNICCWHKNNNEEDNYYKNLYPLNKKQYEAVQEKHNSGCVITEEIILDIMNDIKYKADNWSPKNMKRSLCGVGYLGCNNVDVNSKVYRTWVNMIQRCYYAKVHEYKPYYKSCTVCEEWHNFSNFKVWFEENYIVGRKVDLDKDILIKGNAEYAPDTCVLVTHYTNTIFECRGFKNNIVENLKTGMFDASMMLLGKKMEVGSFGTKEIAQRELFEYKKDYIRQFARKSKKRMPAKVYQAMLNWEIEITD